MADGQRPHVVMLVGNDVTADGRVQKTAASLVAAGLQVTLVDHAPRSGPAPETVAGCPLVRPKVSSVADGRPVGVTQLLSRWGTTVVRAGRFADDRQRRRATYGRKLHERGLASRIVQDKLRLREQPAVAGPLGKVLRRLRTRLLQAHIRGLRLRLRWGRAVHRYRLGAAAADVTAERYRFASDSTDLSRADRRRDWRVAVPDAAAIELAAASVIDGLAPDAIHAHDYLMLPTGAEAVRRARAAGRDVPLVYDAHEYVRGLTTYTDERRRGIAAMEARFLPDADAVVTVSPALAENLVRDHGLATRPTVVLNAPIAAAVAPPADAGVRGEGGPSKGARLLVYSGNVTPARGIHTLIEAMRHLPDDVHLVLVTAHRVPYLVGLLEQAELDGTRARIHLAPYVAPEHVPAYLSTADLGVHPMRRYPNGDIALPNKLFEYIHARLPLVVSDCPAQSAFVRDHGIGGVFRADDAEDLAARVLDVLGDLDRHRASFTDELLATNAWERQAVTLHALYRDLGLLPSEGEAMSDDAIGRALKGLLEAEADRGVG